MIVDTAADHCHRRRDRQILEFNAAAVRLFGYPVADAIGRNVRILMSPSKHDTFIAKYLRTGEASIIGAGRESSADGSTFPIHLSISHLRWRPSVYGDQRHHSEGGRRTRSGEVSKCCADCSTAARPGSHFSMELNEAWRRFNLGRRLRKHLRRGEIDRGRPEVAPEWNRSFVLRAPVAGSESMVPVGGAAGFRRTGRRGDGDAHRHHRHGPTESEPRQVGIPEHEPRALNAILGFGQLLQFNPEEISETQHESSPTS